MIAVTPLIITLDEKENILRCLAALSWAQQIVIVDSGSTDDTEKIARATHPNVKVVTRKFDSFAGQCNFGLQYITTEWVLSIDADYILTPGLNAEIARLEPPDDVAGYSVEFRYCVFGCRLRSSLYPPRTVLYRRSSADYRDEGHGHRVFINGNIKRLSGKIHHDDRKSLGRWLDSQNRYSKIEARHLLATPLTELSFQDRSRKLIFVAPPLIFVYLLFFRGLILDGWPGWFYIFQRVIAEALLSLHLLHAKFATVTRHADNRV